jgi:enamine deaminase RidA (YjgF/YER057c/UK114 family)
VFQNVAKSVIVFISDNADVAAVLLDLQKDLAFLKHASVVVRVPVLPLNSLIEMELMAENNEMAYKSLGC